MGIDMKHSNPPARAYSRQFDLKTGLIGRYNLSVASTVNIIFSSLVVGLRKERIMHRFLLGLIGLALVAIPVSAQTADEIVAKYIKAVGGMEKIQAVKTLRRSGKIVAGGGFELPTILENKRPNMFRQEIILQGLTGVIAYNGKNGWKVEPFQGKKDPESLGEDEMKQAVQESDFDGPLVNYQQKGN